MTKKKINNIRFVVTLLSVLLGINSMYAQKVTVSAKVEPSEIKIGQQAVLELKAIAPKGKHITFPVFNKKLIEGIEVVAMLKTDTVINHDVMTLSQKYLITSFDSTLYHVDYISVLAGKDTLRTKGFGLKVVSPELSSGTKQYLEEIKGKREPLDFVKLKLNDIKNILSAPFVWTDFIIYFLVASLIILLLGLIIVLIILYKRKKEKGYYFKPAVVLPPHVIAIQALDNIKTKKIWQQGLEKEYFTELTDTLREYIEKRYSIKAFEKTSDEILSSLQLIIETESPVESLKQILKLSDLVKFAKYKPLPDENDLSLMNAYLYINQTKIEEVKIPEEGKAPEDDEKKAGSITKNDSVSSDSKSN